MVYAPHGRTGVYMMQDVLRRLAPPDETPQQRLDVARRVMKHLPETRGCATTIFSTITSMAAMPGCTTCC